MKGSRGTTTGLAGRTEQLKSKRLKEDNELCKCVRYPIYGCIGRRFFMMKELQFAMAYLV
jgi:hypothetical protein